MIRGGLAGRGFDDRAEGAQLSRNRTQTFTSAALEVSEKKRAAPFSSASSSSTRLVVRTTIWHDSVSIGGYLLCSIPE